MGLSLQWEWDWVYNENGNESELLQWLFLYAAVRRLMREAIELRDPTSLYHAQPLEVSLTRCYGNHEVMWSTYINTGKFVWVAFHNSWSSWYRLWRWAVSWPYTLTTRVSYEATLNCNTDCKWEYKGLKINYMAICILINQILLFIDSLLRYNGWMIY